MRKLLLEERRKMEGGLTLQVVENGIVIIWVKKKREEKKKTTIQAGLWGRSENGGHVTKVGGGLKSTRLVVVSSQFSKGLSNASGDRDRFLCSSPKSSPQ